MSQREPYQVPLSERERSMLKALTVSRGFNKHTETVRDLIREAYKDRFGGPDLLDDFDSADNDDFLEYATRGRLAL